MGVALIQQEFQTTIKTLDRNTQETKKTCKLNLSVGPISFFRRQRFPRLGGDISARPAFVETPLDPSIDLKGKASTSTRHPCHRVTQSSIHRVSSRFWRCPLRPVNNLAGISTFVEDPVCVDSDSKILSVRLSP